MDAIDKVLSWLWFGGWWLAGGWSMRWRWEMGDCPSVVDIHWQWCEDKGCDTHVSHIWNTRKWNLNVVIKQDTISLGISKPTIWYVNNIFRYSNRILKITYKTRCFDSFFISTKNSWYYNRIKQDSLSLSPHLDDSSGHTPYAVRWVCSTKRNIFYSRC